MRIAVDRGNVPNVFIIEPDLLKLADGRRLPHVYHAPLRLCLIMPGTREWAGTMRIDQTFVPWAATWLFYFEEWLVSDNWKGGGKHPDQNDSARRNRFVRRAVR
ncbi:hypothetical protein [Mesorhizobium sp.]|uniref:hypothetical protein n=1 Tax=Mesorhizobium sp. TaxID=1871066 RepID=UPI0025BCF61B|nr:hypothetical protein [Mesorhizobium sp.]